MLCQSYKTFSVPPKSYLIPFTTVVNTVKVTLVLFYSSDYCNNQAWPLGVLV